MKYDYSKYECPYSHLEKECGHELKSPKGYEGTHSVWCACGFRSPVFYLDPEQLGLKKKGETSTLTNKGAKTAEELFEYVTGQKCYPAYSKAMQEYATQQLAEKEEEIDAWNKICMKKDNYARGLKNQLKATKSELPSKKEIMHKIKKDLTDEIMKPQSDGQRYGKKDMRKAFQAGREAYIFEKDMPPVYKN